MEEREIISFFEDFAGEKMKSFTVLPQSGSSRRNYIGESTEEKFVLTYNSNVAENQSFFYFSKLFTDLNVRSPKILKVNDSEELYIQTYLGDETLSQIISSEGTSDRVKQLVKQTLSELFLLQVQTSARVDYSKTFEYKAYDERPILNDLFYFKNFFADVLEIPYQKSTLIGEFLSLVKTLESLQPRGLMLRDFQARNVMVNDVDEVHFIDYQGAMEGPLMYDVVSLLYQAKANFSESFKAEMLNYYIEQWEGEVKRHLRDSVEPLKLIRFLQVLGAYGFRGLVQGKEHFISSIKKGVYNLQEFSAIWDEMKNYPELSNLIAKLDPEIRQKI